MAQEGNLEAGINKGNAHTQQAEDDSVDKAVSRTEIGVECTQQHDQNHARNRHDKNAKKDFATVTGCEPPGRSQRKVFSVQGFGRQDQV